MLVRASLAVALLFALMRKPPLNQKRMSSQEMSSVTVQLLVKSLSADWPEKDSVSETQALLQSLKASEITRSNT
jgi:hypothetical protein